MEIDDINEYLEELHKMSEDGSMPNPVDDPEGYAEIVTAMRQFMFAMPKYKSGARAEIIEHPSLLGAFGVFFLRLEDAYNRVAELGAEGELKPEEIIREHAFDIAIATFQYVTKAIVHGKVDTVNVGLAAGGITSGTGTGKAKGKLG